MRRFSNQTHPTGIVTAMFVAGILAIALSAPATGQLKNEDIAALREKGKAEGWTFSVSQNSATEYSLEELCGLIPPPDWQESARFDPCVKKLDLPSSFDWRDFGGLPPVRNQGGCGSCWAFATVGPLECNIKIKDGITVDLSEQYLVSCNTNDWGCSGGWWAHAYHQWKKDACYDIGAVPEWDFPYRARDLACDCPYTHTYLIDSWLYIGSSSGVPGIDAMKQAIMEHGPISVAVVANSAMQAYDGGVFNQSASGIINHGVVLVGWDDNQGDSGIWIMRNSWGSWWGENGYMRIEYGCSKIGYGASYIDYPGALRIITGSLPSCSVGVSYSEQLESEGGAAEQTWFVADGGLDGSGLTLSETGSISGIPMAEQDITFTAAVEDNRGRYDEKEFVIVVERYLDGDANATGDINLADAVYILNYVFAGGPSPVPIPASADCDCDEGVSIADAAFIVNYIFKNGPEPMCP
jgi:C1A family cysteine protease